MYFKMNQWEKGDSQLNTNRVSYQDYFGGKVKVKHDQMEKGKENVNQANLSSGELCGSNFAQLMNLVKQIDKKFDQKVAALEEKCSHMD
mmetsp:Transcript_33723/g.32754  ORF Transcript_33723/g.32754 Transcript_33723/m.32754 type:complete len:89 (-) Transcript_33723:775-1041(-)